jgi:hypothetical protein
VVGGGGAHAAGLEGLLSRHRIGYDYQTKNPPRKEICYLEDKKEKKMKRNTSQMYTPTSDSLFIHTFIYFPTVVFWEHSEKLERES